MKKIETKSAHFAFHLYIFLLLGFISAALGPSLPSLSEIVGTSKQEISLIFTIQSIGMLASGFLSGRLIDKYSPHFLLAIYTIPLAGCLLGITIAPTLAILLLMGFGIGVFRSMFDVAGNLLVLWVNPADSSKPIQIAHMTFAFGSFIAPLFIGRFFANAPEQSYYLWAFGFLTVLLPLFLLKKPERPASIVHEEGGISAEYIFPIILVMIIFFLYVGVEIAFGAWVFTYAEDVVQMSAEFAAYVTSAYWGCFFLGRLFLILLGKKITILQTLYGTLSLGIIAMILLRIQPESSTILWIVTALFGIAISAFFPVMLQLADQKMPVTGKVMSYFYIGASLGGSVLPFVTGFVLESISYEWFSLFLAGCLVVTVVLLWLFTQLKVAK